MQILGLFEVYVSLLCLPCLFLILMAWRIAYGRPLYTTPEPTTLNVLYQCALNILFVPPAPAPNDVLDGTAAPVRNPFPFIDMWKILVHNSVVVQAGWDNWGKIAILLDGFCVKVWGKS